MIELRRPRAISYIETLPRYGEKPETHGTGRRCSGCGCVLSVYNPERECAPCMGGVEYEPNTWAEMMAAA